MAKKNNLQAYNNRNNSVVKTNAITEMDKINLLWNSTLNRVKKSKTTSDFNNYHKATDSIYSSSPTGGSEADGRPSLMELQYMADIRIGPANRICFGVAEDAIKNWFNFINPTTKKITYKPKLDRWLIKTRFKKACTQWVTDGRQYGTGFMIKYWGNDEDYTTPPPSTRPLKFEAISPIFLSPSNSYESDGLSYDEELWTFNGGHLNHSLEIHKDRVEVYRPHPRPNHWRGLSALEPIWLSLTCYLNTLIFSVRGVAKWGNMFPVMFSGKSVPTNDELTARISIMQEYIANGFFILGKDDRIEYPNTNIGAGISEIMEFMKEDISSGTKIPISHLFGREAGQGLSSGDLTAERNYLNMLSNVQNSVSDDIYNIFEDSGWDLGGDILDWNLALQKTSMQRLIEDAQRLANETAEEQLKMAKAENKMMREQMKLFKENKDQFNAEEKIENADVVKERSRTTSSGGGGA